MFAIVLGIVLICLALVLAILLIGAVLFVRALNSPDRIDDETKQENTNVR